jgi:hypothetical protein
MPNVDLSFSGTALSLYTTDRMGRKIILILSGAGMAVSMIILGIR